MNTTQTTTTTSRGFDARHCAGVSKNVTPPR
jgi:hypothetical protein